MKCTWRPSVMSDPSAIQSHILNLVFAFADIQPLLHLVSRRITRANFCIVPSHSCNCLIHVFLVCSNGGSRKITWFWILISWNIGFKVKPPSSTCWFVKTLLYLEGHTHSFLLITTFIGTVPWNLSSGFIFGTYELATPNLDNITQSR
jgi:hypothetical protein